MIKWMLLTALLLIFAGQAARAFRPYAKGAQVKTSWMTVSSVKTGQQYYMEVAEDGTVVTRTETRNVIVTRRGKIPQQLAKDFFREIESSDIIASQSTIDNKLVFYKGEILNISAYISGELKRIETPLNNFGEAFSYAFGEVKKASAKLPVDKKLKGFLTAETLEGPELQEFQHTADKDGESKIIETYDIQKAAPLLSAIKQPSRLIPLETAEQVKEIQDFISSHQLSGLRKLFYLPSTRGTFKCQILDAAK